MVARKQEEMPKGRTPDKAYFQQAGPTAESCHLLKSAQLGQSSQYTDLGPVLTQTECPQDSFDILSQRFYLDPEDWPSYTLNTYSTLTDSVPGEFLNYTFQTNPPVHFSEGMWLALLSQCPCRHSLPSQGLLDTPHSLPLTPELDKFYSTHRTI